MIYLQDCTLSDGGRTIGGHFGSKLARRTLSDTVKAGSRYVEIGTLCRKEYHAEFTNYNSVMQANAFLEKKEPSVRYGVCVRADDFALLDRLPEYAPNGIDFIRVVFHTDMWPEALAHCKTIVNRGYGVMVHPLYPSLYPEKKLIAMMDAFSPLSPEAFFIDDSFGTFSADELRQKLETAQRGLPADTAIGLCGRNYLNRQTELLGVFEKAEDTRTFIVHATAGGFGKPGYFFSCQAVAQFLNERGMSVPYDVGRYMSVVRSFGGPLNAVTAEKVMITAAVNCDPNWALYSTATDHPVSEEQFADFVALLSQTQKQRADENAYEDVARRFFQRQWNKKLAVIVPTANRPESVRYYLQQVGKDHEFYGIDLIFYDSSSDDKTERIIEKFTKGKSEHIIYERYTGGFDGISIDEKGISAYTKYSQQYEYLWMTRDGWIINVGAIHLKLGEYLNKKPDAVVLYGPEEDIQRIGYKEYSSCTELFRDSCRRMTILGTVLFSSPFMKKVLNNHPLDMKVNYGMWQPIAMFAQWAEQPTFVISDTFAFYIGNTYGTEKSFWNKNGRALWQITENWYMLITNLPAVYDNDKQEVMKIGHAIFTPFAFRQQLIMRTTGSLTVGKVKQFAKYLPLVSNYSLKRFYLLSILPKSLCRAMLNPNSIIGKAMNRIADTYSAISKLKQLPSPIPKDHDITAFDASRKNNNIFFADNDLCIIFPVCGRTGILRENLKKTLAQYEKYNISVIIYDGSADDEVRNLICDDIALHYKNIHYERYREDQDTLCDDEMIISAYKSFSNKYHYVWIMRDICLADLKFCAYQLWQAIKEGRDIIVFSRGKTGETGVTDKALQATEYDDPVALFRDAFESCLFHENLILKSDTVAAIMTEQPFCDNNCGFWQSAALFHYIAQHSFSADLIVSDIFCYHPSDILEQQEKNVLWQWVERFSAVVSMLPMEYDDERENVLYNCDRDFGFVHPLRLLRTRIAGKYRLRDVYKYGKNVSFVSGTSFSQLLRIGLTPRFLAKLKAAQPCCFLWKHSLMDIDRKKVGRVEDKGTK